MRPRLFLSALAVCAAAWSQEIVLRPDPAHTTVQFKLGATLHTVHGTFQLARGAVRYNPATGHISGEIVVDAASGKSGDPKRDRNMHRDVLQSVRYPEIVFTPDRVTGTIASQGDSRVQVHGTFRIHGTAHEITLPVDVHMSGGQVSVKTNFTIPYVEWGMKNPSTLLLRVSDKVEIEAAAVALP
ncbi:MAG TPA: YceI family protein [Bryobacteraceae bacterium]|jgi:polyisoprenoid-binding protein YceI|nr:YceI family protein [Bryobacteraceae bacterium]